ARPPRQTRPERGRMRGRARPKARRFAGQFKRQTPVGRQIPDFVSFVHRLAIELVNPDESEAIVADRAARKDWLEQRDYRVVLVKTADVENDLGAQVDLLQRSLTGHS